MDRELASQGQPRSRPSGLGPRSIPDHELIRPIGGGSYGEVWLARNIMGVYRAVKVVHESRFRDRRPFERELSGIRRFEPLSRSHEGFVDVLHVGSNEDHGYFYYIMELGDDVSAGQEINPDTYTPKTLGKEIVSRGRLPAQEALRLGLSLSEALSVLHGHGLVHRDIKPSNVIFVNGVAKLADIGLVAGLDEARSFVGTEGFIPPEGPGSPQADVYSLGKLLYEASTGKDRQDFPELPSDCYAWPDFDELQEINEIILEACAADQAKRYASAADLHADLQVAANGKSIKRLKLLERRLQKLKRLTQISLAVALLAGVVGRQLYVEWRRKLEIRQQQVGANTAYGNRSMEAGDLLGALPYFAEALRLESGDPARALEHRFKFASIRAQAPNLLQMWFSTGQVQSVAFSPDGKQVLNVQGDGKAQVLDLASGNMVCPPFGQGGYLRASVFSPDGKLVAIGSEDKSACIWRTSDGALMLRFDHPDKVMAANFSPDGQRLVTGCLDGIARVWSLASREVQVTCKGHTNAILFAGFSHDGALIVTGSRDFTARLWDASTGMQRGPTLRHPSWVGSADFSPDDKSLVTACYDHKARVWAVSSGELQMPELTHRDGVSAVRYSPDGETILTACLDRTVRLWQGRSHEPANTHPVIRHSDRVITAAFNPDGTQIISGCADGTARLWDLARFPGTRLPGCDSISEDGTRCATISEGAVQVWATATREPASPLIPIEGTMPKVSLSRDGTFVGILAVQTNAPGWKLNLRESRTGKLLSAPMLLQKEPVTFALSRDGNRLLILSLRSAQVWDVNTGQRLCELASQREFFLGAILSPNATELAAWTGMELRWCDVATGKEKPPVSAENAPIDCVKFSPDGKRLLTCESDQKFTKCTARIWDTTTGQRIGAPLPHADGVLFASFSNDGMRVATAAEDFTAMIWALPAGTPVTAALKHEEQVNAAIFSPDNRWLVTAASDGTARIWSAETGDQISPPFEHLQQRVVMAWFLPSGQGILTKEASGSTWLWNVFQDGRPASDLVLLARLLSGNLPTAQGQTEPGTPGSQLAAWQWLRAKYPSDFSSSNAEIARWRSFQADQSEHKRAWKAASFHLQRLAALMPSDETIRARLLRVQASAAAEK